MTIKPVRLQLSRKKGFDLQALSVATNGLQARSVARPGPFGNWLCIGNPGRIWIHRGEPDGLQVTLTADLPMAVDAVRAVASHRRWLETSAAAAPSRGTAWLIPGFDKLQSDFQKLVERELWAKRSETLNRLHFLKGHNVACTCALDQPCHGDTLLEMANAST